MELLVGIIVVRTICDVSFKKAVNHLSFDSVASITKNVLDMIKNPFLWVGVIAGLANYVLWIYALQNYDLSYAYPFLSIVYVSIILSGKFLFKERLGFHKIMGLLFIMAGASLLFIQ